MNLTNYHWRELPQISLLSRQKFSFVTTGILLSRQKTCFVFVATKVSLCLSRQAYFCRDKRRVLLRTFVATKIILVAAPASDGKLTPKRKAWTRGRNTSRDRHKLYLRLANIRFGGIGCAATKLKASSSSAGPDIAGTGRQALIHGQFRS